MPAPIYEPTDRRPIAARNRAVFQRMAAALAARGCSANGISIWGMISALFAGAALFATAHWPDIGRVLLLIAALGIQLRLLANMLDGMVAIASGKASAVGELYNEAPDRISDMAVLIGAGYAVGGDITLGYLAACFALLVAYIRTLGKSAGAANEFCGPMAKQQRMFLVTMTCLYIALTPSSWQPVITISNRPFGLLAITLTIIILGCIVTGVRRLKRIVETLGNESSKSEA